MSRVHDAMRSLEQKSAPENSAACPANLVSALIGELADEIADDPSLEGVRLDLLGASRSYESDKKKDLALRFYLAMRSLLRTNEILQQRVAKAEKKHRALEGGMAENANRDDREEGTPEVHTMDLVADSHSERALSQHA